MRTWWRARAWLVAGSILALGLVLWMAGRNRKASPAREVEHLERSDAAALAVGGSHSLRVPAAKENDGPQLNGEQALPSPEDQQPPVLLESAYSDIDLLQMDPAFIEACARPQEVEFETLEKLVAKAKTVFSQHVNEENEKRVNAGLYERVPDYIPEDGVRVKFAKDDELRSVYFQDGEALRVSLPKGEYPVLYAFRSEMNRLESELRVRKAVRARDGK